MTLRLRGHVIQVSAGTDSVAAVVTGGLIYTWGANGQGQCGVGHLKPLRGPTLVDINDVAQAAMGDFQMLVLQAAGGTFECGLFRSEDHIVPHSVLSPTRTIGGLVAKQVATGGSMSMVLVSSRTLFTWATNSTPCEYTHEHADVEWACSFGNMGSGGCYCYRFMATSSKTVLTAGADYQNRLGLGQHQHMLYGQSWVDEKSPVSIPSLEGLAVKGIAMQSNTAVAFGDGFAPLAWGSNWTGIGGIAGAKDLNVPTSMHFGEETVQGVSLASAHGVAVTDSGTVWTWGRQSRGMGGGDAVPAVATEVGDRFVHHVAAGEEVTYCFCNNIQDKVLRIENSALDVEGLVTLRFLSMSGEVVATLHVSPEQTLGQLRNSLAQQLNLKPQQLKLLVPEAAEGGAKLLTTAENAVMLTSLLSI